MDSAGCTGNPLSQAAEIRKCDTHIHTYIHTHKGCLINKQTCTVGLCHVMIIILHETVACLSQQPLEICQILVTWKSCCVVHAAILFIKQHRCIQSAYLSNSPYTYIYTCIPQTHKRHKNSRMWSKS
jgi:hypothetical protein